MALLVFALRGISLSDLRPVLAAADYRWLAPATLAVVAGQVGRAARWRALFGPAPRPSLSQAFAILSIGYVVSLILPLRLGDAVRAWLVESRTPGDGATALGTVVAERVVDLLTILVLMAVWVPGPGAALARRLLPLPWLTEVVMTAGVLSMVAAAYVLLAAVTRTAGLAEWGVRQMAARMALGANTTERMALAAGRFARAFGPLATVRGGLAITGWSAVTWLVGACGYWLVFRVFDLNLDFGAAMFAMCASAVFAALLPPAPGYVGAFHAAVREALAVYAGVGAAAAAAYALVLHGVTVATLVAMGGWAVLVLGLPEGALRAAVVRGQ